MSMIIKRMKIKLENNFQPKKTKIKELDKLTFYVKIFVNRFKKAEIDLKWVLQEMDMSKILSIKSHHQKRHRMIHLKDLLSLTNIKMGNLKGRLKSNKNGIHTLIL